LNSGEALNVPGMLEQIIQRADGTQRIIQTQSVPVPTTRGYMLVGTVRDVTDLKQLEADLRRSEVRYRALFEQANDAIMLENERDEIIDVNQHAADLLGYTRAELLALHVSDLQAPEVRGRSGQVVADELARHNGRPFEALDLHRDGHRVPVEITETRLSGPDAGLVLTIVRDITGRKRVEQALRENEEQFRLAFQAAATGKALVGTNGRFLRVNPALCQMLGYTEEELLSKTFNDMTHPADVAIGQDYFRRVMAGELDSVSFEKRYLRRDGTPIWVIVSSSLIRDAQGQPGHFISEMQDISERKQAELALRDRNPTLCF
jgi:PAS domain S-box-containing protein